MLFKHRRDAARQIKALSASNTGPKPFGPSATRPNAAWALGVSVFGQVFPIGTRGEYAQPQNAIPPNTLFAQVPQFNFDNGGKQWCYSYGAPTVGTDFELVQGNPPQGGFSTPVVVGQVQEL